MKGMKNKTSKKTDLKGGGLKEKKIIEAKGTMLASNIAKKNYQESLSNHPWYDRNIANTAGGLEAHHIITNKNLNTPNWRKWREAYDYDINEYQNGVMFPSNPQIACQVETQVHRSHHSRGLMYSDELKRNYIDKKKPIPDRECVKLYKDGMKYIKGVNEEIDDVFKRAKSKFYCKKGNSDKFTLHLRAKSVTILENIASFKWTISRYGKDYHSSSKIGCAGGTVESAEKSRKPCPHRINKNVHKYKNGHNKIMKSRTLEVGK